MGFFSQLANKIDDVKYDARRALKKARKKNNVESNFDLATKIAGEALGKAGDVAEKTLDLAGKVGKVACEKLGEMNEEMQRLYAEYSDYDSKQLYNIYKTSHGLKKAVIGKILRERHGARR